MEHSDFLHSIELQLALIIFLGIFSRWIAWKLRFPSILLLLVVGFVVGPVTGILIPDRVFGEMLFPLVSFSVAIILFEGGLTLRFSEIRKVSGAVFGLISIGAIVTWVVGTWAAREFLHLSFSLSLLLGAILTVSGPTVVLPMLRQIRPKEPLGSILKWEGILIDPVGAVLAVLVLNAIQTQHLQSAFNLIVFGVLKSAFIGGFFGLLGGVFLLFLLRKKLVPEYLQNGVTLAILLLVFLISNHLALESGLLTVTVMGIFLANTTTREVKHIIDFKENLRVLLISSLFIMLAARVEMNQIQSIGTEGFLFLGVMILISRPLAVILSTMNSSMQWNERLFLSAIAPRGIVAAAVSSLFALELAAKGYQDADLIVSYTFFIICGTVLIYGLSSGVLSRLLKVSDSNPEGTLLVGAHPFGRALAQELQYHELPVLLIDTNPAKVRAARDDGLSTYQGNILSENVLEDIDLSGIGRLLCLTPNDEANSLACVHFAETFGEEGVFQLPPHGFQTKTNENTERSPRHLRGNYLFGKDQSFSTLTREFSSGAVIKTVPITEEFSFEAYQEYYGERGTSLLLIKPDRSIHVFSTESNLKVDPGDRIIVLLREDRSEE